MRATPKKVFYCKIRLFFWVSHPIAI